MTAWELKKYADSADRSNQLDRIRAKTGVVRHETDEACHGCGCRMLSAEECVDIAIEKLKARIAELEADKERILGKLCGPAGVERL